MFKYMGLYITRYGMKILWDSNYRCDIKQSMVKQPVVQVFDNFRVSIEKLKEFIEYFSDIIDTKPFHISKLGGINIQETEEKCNYCGNKNENIKLSRLYEETICENCIENGIKKLEKIYENILLYDNDAGVLISKIPHSNIPSVYLQKGDIVICLGKRNYPEHLFFCNGINFDNMMKRIKRELDNVGFYGELPCYACSEDIEGDSVMIDFKETNMGGVSTQRCQQYHKECLEKIVKKLNEFSEEYSSELVSKNI